MMKRKILTFLLAVTLPAASLLAGAQPTPEDDKVAARRGALEVAGAWSNDGFKIRDGHWSGTFKVGEPKMVQVNLFAGNQYWFSLATSDGVKKVGVTVYNENGQPVKFEPWQDGARAAAGFSPTVSGPYYVKVEELDGVPASFALVYSYK